MSLMFPSAGALLALTLLSTPVLAKDPPPLVSFSGAIGSMPAVSTTAGNQANLVRGIAAGGLPWVLRKLEASVGTDGSISARGKGLLFAAQDRIGTRGPVTAVVATLTCGAADATARRFTSPPAALDLAGNFRITGVLSEDGINAAVMPATCDNPALLIRSFNTTTNVAGNWFAAGIVGGSDD
ncbi:MAG: hypothetical protein U1F56_21505 [Rubrivivax sp.]